MSNYKPVKREDIDLNKKYHTWVNENEHEEIYHDDLVHYVKTGHLYHDGYEVGESARDSIFEEPIYKNDSDFKGLPNYKKLWNNLKDRLSLGIKDADGDWDTSVAEQILKEMKEDEAKG